MSPSIVIVIPVYNGARYLEEAINSVLNQSSPHWRLHLVDDCSTDRSQEIMRLYKTPHVSLFFNEENVGLYGTLNKTIGNVEEEWIVILMQDDRLKLLYIETATHLINKHLSVKAFGPMRQLFPMLRGCFAELLRTAFSNTMHPRPMVMDPLSAMTCAPYIIRQSEPIVTLPQTTAFGAMKAVGSM